MNRHDIDPPPKQGLYDPRFERDSCGMGFVANVQGVRSHAVIRRALTVLENMEHRGGRGSEPDTGDGAGIMIQIPHAFLRREMERQGIILPEEGDYAAGMLFLPRDETLRKQQERELETIIREEGQEVIGWRTVPVNPGKIGRTARAAMPFIRQLFIRRTAGTKRGLPFERKLYLIRKRAEREIRCGGQPGGASFYAVSLSSRTLVYKGMLTTAQLRLFYPDLSDPVLESALALVHSRFSTNTFPSWNRAHPYRYLIHNGEINTLRGNLNWMHARLPLLASDLFGDDLAHAMPVIEPDGSDSAMFDNVLELLHLAGRSLPHAMMMMVPEPWANDKSMSDEKRAFYEYHSMLMEPWDGPAAMAFTDGVRIGALLDRNGLRPARYCVTKDGHMILASEAGALELPQDQIVCKDRLRPGRMLLVDTERRRIVPDEELKAEIAASAPYRAWLDEHLIRLEQLPDAPRPASSDGGALRIRQLAFGYTYEEIRKVLEPMAVSGSEPIGSMGFDAPLAVLSERPQRLYNYFKQLFAQVTNPPIDAIREEIVTSTVTTIGPERNLLRPEPESCRHIRLETPILSDEQLAKLRHIRRPGFRALTIPMLFPAAAGEAGLRSAVRTMCEVADRAAGRGYHLFILSDRGIDRNHAAIPALLAVSALHHHLIRSGTRTKVSLLLESGEPREVHHFALLIGYGADAVNPYLAYETLAGGIESGMLRDITYEQAVRQYIEAATKGIVKIMSKMGISAIQSYRGAQIFEAVGLAPDVIDEFFPGTVSRIGGIGLDVIAAETAAAHRRAYAERDGGGREPDSGGDYQWRREGEDHLFNPQTIHLLQQAARRNDYELYKEYSALVQGEERQYRTLRSLLRFKPGRPVPLEEVEPVESIVKRFKTGAMSYGSISPEAHEALAIAMNRLGGKSNSGEGGEDPRRYVPDAHGNSRRSAIKQVASGRFGVTSHYLVNADEIQIKMAQGAKPGEGGQLPGRKVYPWIAEVRGSTPGVGLISPPPHHDIYSIEDLAELIHDLKNANPRARIGVKLVSEAGVGTVAAGVAKGLADVILISGYDGGTGASPLSSIRHAGLPWELGLAETHQTLMLNNLRGRVTLEVDGKLMTGRDLAIAALLGAEEFGFSTAPLVVLGCVMMRVCHLDTCPVGIATQNPELRKNYAGDPDYIVNFMRFAARELRGIMADLGFRTVDEMVGRADMLEADPAAGHGKARSLDLSVLLHRPDLPDDAPRRKVSAQRHGLEASLDMRVLLPLARPALERREPVSAALPIRSTNRAAGTLLGSEVTRRFGAEGLPDDTIRFHFAGSAGQSFGAFLPKGITLSLEGEANDYVGKGLSGGRLIIAPSRQAAFTAEENVIIGNTALYGATGGEAYIRGIAGERFAVRNSGADAVVEGVGDHGCEYMTGGRVVVLGRTGRNFAAGMSGGIAYIYDVGGDAAGRINRGMVELERIGSGRESGEVREMIRRHAELTGSAPAQALLADWERASARFVKVIPKEYKRMTERIEAMHARGLTGEQALLAAFEESVRGPVRAGGN